MSTPEPSIGIDLGTTNSAVATATDGKPRMIERATGQRLLPSMVGVTEDGKLVCGEEARLLSESLPESVAYATKRFCGRRWTTELAAQARTMFPYALVSGPNDDIRVKLGGQTLPVVQIASLLLGELRADAEAHFNTEVKKAVITVPANFNDSQRQATKEAAQIAGLEVIRLVNEPTAAAIAYGLATKFTGNVVVFDLGGGTFDVSVLDVREGVFEVLATGGDPFLGGEDFDQVLVQWLLAHIADNAVRERVSHDRPALMRLKAAAEQAKKAVSTVDKSRIAVTLLRDDKKDRGVVVETVLARDFFEKLVRPKTEQCLKIVDRTLLDAGVDPGNVGEILLVGGMTRVPLLRQMVAERFGKPPQVKVNPDEAVALGAAMHAAELTEKSGSSLLLDVVGSSLSVGIAGGLVKPLIKRNTKLPCTATEIFYPGHDGQAVARLPVVQGESNHATENALLGEVKLQGLQGKLRSEQAIEVTFEMATDGTISVTAKDTAGGKAESLRIEARPELRPQERERLEKLAKERHDNAAPAEDPDRETNRHARRALHQVLVSVRRLHRDLKLAADETDNEAVKEMAEQLGRRVVEAEKVESSGEREQVVALTRALRELLSEMVVS